jgi:hypothetical protein
MESRIFFDLSLLPLSFLLLSLKPNIVLSLTSWAMIYKQLNFLNHCTPYIYSLQNTGTKTEVNNENNKKY